MAGGTPSALCSHAVEPHHRWIHTVVHEIDTTVIHRNTQAAQTILHSDHDGLRIVGIAHSQDLISQTMQEQLPPLLQYCFCHILPQNHGTSEVAIAVAHDLATYVTPDQMAIFNTSLPTQVLLALTLQQIVDEDDELMLLFEDTREIGDMVADAVLFAQITTHPSRPFEECLVDVDDPALHIDERCRHGDGGEDAVVVHISPPGTVGSQTNETPGRNRMRLEHAHRTWARRVRRPWCAPAPREEIG